MENRILHHMCPLCKAEIEVGEIKVYRAYRTDRKGRRRLLGVTWTCPNCEKASNADHWFPCEWTPGAMP